MGIRHIFISHASEDSEIATELTLHLRNAGHEAKVDTQGNRIINGHATKV